MQLEQRLQSFIDWMHQYVLAGFQDYIEDNYGDDHYNSIEDMLEMTGISMRDAILRNDFHSYIEEENYYKQKFLEVNKKLAKTHYQDQLDYLLDSGLSNENATVMAASDLWKDYRYRKHLDISVKIYHACTRDILYIVGSLDHITEVTRPYITAEEIQNLNNRDPWEYVRSRDTRPGAIYG